MAHERENKSYLFSSLKSWLPVKTREWRRLGNSVEKHDSWTLPLIAKGHWTSNAVPAAVGWVAVQPFWATLHPELQLSKLLIKADTRALVTIKRSKRNFPNRNARGVTSLFYILSVSCSAACVWSSPSCQKEQTRWKVIYWWVSPHSLGMCVVS